MKKQNFIQAASVIALAQLLVKIIGAFYKIPLDRFILQTEGMGIFSTAYTIFNWLLVVSTVGLPVAISKIVAEKTALSKAYEAYRVFVVARRFLLAIGLVGFSVMFFGTKIFADVMNAPSAWMAIAAIAPSVLFVSLNSSYRGYYQGRQNMIPTAVSEVIEAVLKLVLGILLAYMLKLAFEPISYAATGAVTGVMLGTFASFAFLSLYHLKVVRKEKPVCSENESVPEWKATLLEIIKIAVPVTLGASVFTISSLIDTALVMDRLSILGYAEAERFSLYGYLNRAITMFNMPLTIISAITVSVVPMISHELSLKNKLMAEDYIRKTFKISVFASLPCAIGLAVLSENIFLLMYGDGAHSTLLVLMGIAVLFAVLSQITTSILQAYGKVWWPVINMAIGAVVKIVVSYNLVANPVFNINGASVGTICCYLTVTVLNIIRIKSITKMKLGIKDFIIKPSFLAIVTFLAAFFTVKFISNVIPSNIIQVGITVIVTAIVYFAVLFAIKGITKEELMLIKRR